jgi:hypothetical protein
MSVALHVKCPLFLSELIQSEFSRQICEQPTDFMCHENSTSGSRVLACGPTHMTKLIVAFHNIANAPKIVSETENVVDSVD